MKGSSVLNANHEGIATEKFGLEIGLFLRAETTVEWLAGVCLHEFF
jgi:hypothetical protein